MFLYYLPIIFVLGLLIGSFLNVVIYRYNSSLPIIFGRSKCFSCGKELGFWEMIPVLSFLLQRGKCKGCESKISKQYIFVELLTAIVLTFVFYRQYTLAPLYLSIPNGLFYLSILSIFYFIVYCILIVIALYDLKHKIIPDGLVYFFSITCFLKLLYFIFNFGSFSGVDMYDFLAPFVLFGFFGLLWLVSRGQWIGFGDVKLSFGIGAMLGFISGVSAIILGFWLGALYVVLLFLLNKISPDRFGSIYRGMEIPFAPFLILGIFIAFIFKIDVLNISFFIS
jgi:prepilin signal peptidase PulO-like enzyme (type II secretory pathway)